MTPPLTRGFGWRSRHGAAAPIEKLLALLSAEGPGGLWRRLQARRQGRLPRPLHSLDLPWRPRPPRPCLPDLAADIVVPVYEAPEALAACLESLRRHTDLTRHRLLVVDDGSRSPAVFELLNELERWAGVDGARVEIMRQAENRGFVASANLGFARAKGDVVLLNSDTEVTPGWLERLAGAAHSAPDVASVTPFSNDATICSLPRLGEANRLPPGWSPAQFASLVERLSPRLLPELPTGVGFCLYLRREALEQVGTFDEETFGAGYGEENDWCMRAAELGWRHLLEDATFVFHRGSASFSPAEVESGGVAVVRTRSGSESEA